MAEESNKSKNLNNIIHTDVQVKIEPGTSASSMPSVPLLETVSKSIKVEPGFSKQRLTSYRLPRDLTLGGNMKTEKQKKVYIPNVNVQRNKKKDEATSVKVETAKSRYIDRGRGRGRGDRGRERGGGRGNVIPSAGIWSGIYTKPIHKPTIHKRSNSPKASSSTDVRKDIEKPKLNISKVVDKEDEEKLLKLLRDDFIDDDTDTNGNIEPLKLPRVEKAKNSDEKIKKELVTSEEVTKETLSQDEKKTSTISQIIENKANSYILIQLPDRLPGLESSKEESGPKRSNDSNSHSESDNKAKTEGYNLNNLKSGLLGKLEILKSGRTRLRLGETSFFVDVGAQQRFKQDLLVAKVDTVSLTGDLINLGPVNNKLLCSPNFESMLENS